MPNSVLWVCLVAIWLFVLVPMVIQGRPEIRKSTPVAAATRVIKRGEEAVRRRRIGSGAHPHDPDYQPKERPKTTRSAAKADRDDAGAESAESEATTDEQAADTEVTAPIDPSRIPGKVPTVKRGAARTVAARMRRVVSVSTSRSVGDEITEVIPAVRADAQRVTAGSLVDGEEIIDAEIVEAKGSETVEVHAIEVIDVEITERIDPIADESPTQKIDKVVDEKAGPDKKGGPVEATLFDIEEDVDDEPISEVAEDADAEELKADEAETEDLKAKDAETEELKAEVADGEDLKAESVEDAEVEEAERDLEAESEDDAEAEIDDDLVDELEELDDSDDAELAARWDDVDPNELTQIMMTRPGRGEYDPEVDRARLELKYKERQRVLLTLVGLTLVAIGAGVLFSTPGWIAAGVAGFFLAGYLVFLRRAVTTEAQIRHRRLARLERNRRDEVERRRREPVESLVAGAPPAPRPRVRRPSGMQVVAIDDEDPVFDHLPIYEPPRMMRSDDDYRRAAV